MPKSEKIENAGVEPGDLIQIEWTSTPESDQPNEQPTDPGVPSQELAHGAGLVFQGSLTGIGWADAAMAAVIEDNNCPGDSGTRSPLGTGDYIEDVDFVIVDVAEAGTLCAAVIVDADSVGWDMAAQPIDPCKIPLGVVLDSRGEPVGIDLGGASGGWSANVEPGPVAIGFAGYAPNDDQLDLAYSVALSIVRERSDGSEGVCPTHPEIAR